MNFYQALKKMDESEKRCYIRLMDTFETVNDEGKDDIVVDEYIVMLNPCWLAEVKFVKNGETISRVPTSVLLSEHWEVVEV